MNAKSPAKMTRAQIVSTIKSELRNGCTDARSTITYFNDRLQGKFTQNLLIDVVSKFDFDAAHGRTPTPVDNTKTDDKPTEKVLDKIKKLLAVANDTRGNINETTAAARQAAVLMQQHNVSMAEMIESEK